MSYRKTEPRVRPVRTGTTPSVGAKVPVRTLQIEHPPVSEEAQVEYLLAADELIATSLTRLPAVLRSANAQGLSPAEKLVIIIGPTSPVGGPPSRDGIVKMGPCSRSQFAATSFPFGDMRAALAAAPECGHWHVLACTDRAARYRCTVCHLGLFDVTATAVS